MPILSREIRDLGASPFIVGIVGSVYGGIQLFSSPIVVSTSLYIVGVSLEGQYRDIKFFGLFQGKQSDKYGRKTVIISMLAATAVAYVIQGSATSLQFLLVARSLAGEILYSPDD